MATRRSKPVENVLVQLGLPDAEELSAKVSLAVRINDLIEARKLNQVDAARVIGMTQPKVSQIHNYRLQNLSLERLMHVLTSLGQRVEISVRSAKRKSLACIAVAA
jgi:predicted XRE-type DNA-binding protein